jgi:hypothetical protein
MSTSEQKPKIICVEHEYDTKYESNTSYQPQIDLENQPELPVSQKTYVETYTAYYINERFVVIRIDSTNTLVKVEHRWQSKPFHVHIIEHLCPVCDIYGNEFYEVSGHTIFVIFNDHILRICLTNISNVSSFEECKTDFSFRISPRIEASSFTIIEDERNECLRACLVSDELCWKKVELFEICLFRDDERLFGKMREKCFRLPPNFMVIEIDCDSNSVTLCLKGESIEFPIYIYDEKTDALDDYYASPIFLLNECERCILATSDQLERFQRIHFDIVATMYVCPIEDHDDFPEIQKFIKVMLEELNKYHRCHQDDSDDGSDSD